MNFTIFLNSRGRASQLEQFISLFEEHTSDHSKTEMIIRGDEDDELTVNLLNSLYNRKTLQFKTIIGPRPQSLCGSFNDIVKVAKGRYLFVMNDDAEIYTKNWDIIALSKIKEFQETNKIKDDIIYCNTFDTSVDKPANKKYASFPIISAQAVNVLGFFMHDKFVGLGGDSAIYRVYESIKRVIDIPEIKLACAINDYYDGLIDDMPTGICMTPHIYGSLMPQWNEHATTAITGITADASTARLYRAVLEGTCC